MVQVAPGLQMVHRGGVIGPIDRAAIRARNQMPARVDRDLQTGFRQHPLEEVTDVPLLERRTGARWEDPGRHVLPFLQPSLLVDGAPLPQGERLVCSLI